jgi:hypothetical protein
VPEKSGERESTDAFDAALDELADVGGSVGPLELTLAMFLAFKVGACKLRAVAPALGALSVLFVIDPIATIAVVKPYAYIVPS